jgi:hypothetical protein
MVVVIVKKLRNQNAHISDSPAKNGMQVMPG